MENLTKTTIEFYDGIKAMFKYTHRMGCKAPNLRQDANDDESWVYIHTFEDGTIYVGSTSRRRPSIRFGKLYHNKEVESRLRTMDVDETLFLVRKDLMIDLEQEVLDLCKSKFGDLVLNKKRARAQK